MSLLLAILQAGANGERRFHAVANLDANAGFSLRTWLGVLCCGACYYLATQVAWAMCFPGSKVSLFFPPHGVLVSILLLVPARHWLAYVLAALGAHFVATQQAGWPPLVALHAEAYDGVTAVLTAAAMRALVHSPFARITLREAVVFVVIAVVLIPFGTALWGAAIAVSSHFGTGYWTEWRNLGVSNAVTTIVLVPTILLGIDALRTGRASPSPARVVEACVLAAGIFAIGYLAFDRMPAGPDTSPALLYAPVPLLIWAVLRFGLGGMSAATLAITVLAIWGTMHGRGPFLTQSPAENALALRLFLLFLATPLLLLAVAIADERRSKAALRGVEERLSLAAESAQLALWDWDTTNDQVWLTDEGRQLFGLGPDEAIDYATLGGRVHPDDRPARAEAIRQALATGNPYESEFRLLLPDGSLRWIAARGRGTGLPGGTPPTRIRGVSMDITQQKLAAEEAHVQRQELAHLARVAALGTLSSSLAHELSQPLASILSNAQAGQRFLAKDPPDLDELRDILEHIVSQDRRAGEIIHRLRNLLSRGEVALQPVDVDEALDELLRLARSDLLTRGITVSRRAAAGLPRAMTDRVQLQQVALNLIMNACDAMSSVAPEQRELTITTSVANGEFRVGVLDRGTGLPEDVDSMFLPFHTTKADGLGVGLAICRTLLTAHRGRLWAEPRAGGGAAFHVALPLAKEDAP